MFVFQKTASEMHDALQIISSTFNYFCNLQPRSSICNHLHPPVSTCLHLHPSVTTCIHLHPLAFTCVHLFPPASTCIHLRNDDEDDDGDDGGDDLDADDDAGQSQVWQVTRTRKYRCHSVTDLKDGQLSLNIHFLPSKVTSKGRKLYTPLKNNEISFFKSHISFPVLILQNFQIKV